MSVVDCLKHGLVLVEIHSILTVVADLQGLSPLDITFYLNRVT